MHMHTIAWEVRPIANGSRLVVSVSPSGQQPGSQMQTLKKSSCPSFSVASVGLMPYASGLDCKHCSYIRESLFLMSFYRWVTQSNANRHLTLEFPMACICTLESRPCAWGISGGALGTSPCGDPLRFSTETQTIQLENGSHTRGKISPNRTCIDLQTT